MGVTSKAYTKEDVKNMNTDQLRAAVPEILKTFNDNGRTDMKVWEVYHEAALKLDASNADLGSQNEHRQASDERHTNKYPYIPSRSFA